MATRIHNASRLLVCAAILWICTPGVGASAEPPPVSVAKTAVATKTPIAAKNPVATPSRRIVGLEEVLELADTHNIELLRAGATHRLAEGRAREAKLRWVPELKASAGISTTDGQVQGSFGKFRDVDFQSAEPFGRLAYEINPAEVLFRTRAADDRVGQAGARQHAVRNHVLTEAAVAYYELALANAAVGVMERARDDGRELLRIAELLARQGSGRGDEVERARAELAGSEQRLSDAKSHLATTSIRLAVALDLDPTVQLVPAEPSPEKVTLVANDSDVAALVQRALRARPEHDQAQSLIRARRSDRQAAMARLAAPTLEAFYQEGATGGSYRNLSGLTQYGLVASWTLSASQLAGVDTARQREDEAKLVARELEQAVASQVAGAVATAEAAGARIEPARQALHAANETARMVRVRFEHGRSLAIEVIDAQKLVEEARLNAVKTVVDYNKAQLRLRSALGRIEPSDLSADLSAAHKTAKPEAAGG